MVDRLSIGDSHQAGDTCPISLLNAFINRSVSTFLSRPLKGALVSKPHGAMSSLRRLRTAFFTRRAGLMAHHYPYGGHWCRTESVIVQRISQEAFEAGFLLRLQQTLIMQRETVTPNQPVLMPEVGFSRQTLRSSDL